MRAFVLLAVFDVGDHGTHCDFSARGMHDLNKGSSHRGFKIDGSLLGLQLAGVIVLALLPIAYPTYVGIFIVTGALRLVAAATADVGDDWNTATRIHHGEEMPAEAAFESQR